MEKISAYERQRQLNIKKNKEMLESLGLFKPFRNISTIQRNNSNKQTKKRKRQTVSKENKKNIETDENKRNLGHQILNSVRRSLRVKGINPECTKLSDVESNQVEKSCTIKKSCYPKRENVFGEIEGIPVGTTWATRIECSRDGIHRPTVAGIHGSEIEGCYSLALSGGYEDDIDLGESFTYTGEGGRDLKGTKANPKNLRTAPQSKHQSLTKGNLALSRNVENRRPVRVIRGYKLLSQYAPEEGYRYEGLYTVEKCWEAVGLSGFLVYKYILTRCPDQDTIAL